jgi:prophage tail gpP-like protein
MGRGGGQRVTTTYRKGEDGELEQVASEVYGDPSKGSLLWSANPGLPTSGKIKAGKQLIIPGARPLDTLTGKERDDLTVIIDGIHVPVMSARVVRTIDTGADGWSARIAWTPGQFPKLDHATRPYGYPRAAVYLGNELVVGGCLYTVEPEMTTDGMTKGLHGFSFTADAIDSTVQPPYEFNGVTLKQLANALLPPLGIKAVWECDPGPAFGKVTANETESIFAFLSKLASQRGILVSCTPQGDMLFLRAAVDSKSIGTVQEGGRFAVGWKARYDGRLRYNQYRCITKSSSKTGKVLDWKSPAYSANGSTTRNRAVVIEPDDTVPRSRWITFHADDTTPGDIRNAAKWKKNRQFVQALTQEFPVSDWYGPDGKLWRPNTIVTVISPTLGVPQGFDFLIRAVEFRWDDSREATLSLVPPQAYTGKDIGEVWTSAQGQ